MPSFSGKAAALQDGPLGEIGRQLYPPAAVCSGALSLGVHGWVLNRRLCGGQGGVGQGTLLGCAH